MVVQCDDRWSCCQREQAKAKVTRMNEALKPPANPVVQPPGFSRGKGDNWCKSQAKRMDKMSSADQAQEARAAGAPDCLAEQLEGNPSKNIPPSSREKLGLALDHSLDMKLGGRPMQQHLMPMDSKVNGAFGSFARVCGDKVGTGNKVSEVKLVCPPSPTGCPPGSKDAKDNSVGTAAPIAPSEWSTSYAFT